jgi:2-oxoglutarate ferredoxin oxidoreductase subunit beta
MSGNGDLIQLTAKDFKSDQEVRWCPGCGDYAILAAVQGFMPELGLSREKIVFVSGIGCAARFPYYMETYGMHSIHGRAPAIATGLATARPDLSVWVIGGDGDMLSIGGNHLIHALRRNVNLNILLLNNRIYGLTKGQYSPTSERGKVTKSTPMGSIDQPFNPLSVAIGAEATFVARAIDTDKKELTEVLRAAVAHKGASFVEVFQNCNIYNDGAFDFVREQKENRIYLRAGEPITWGADGEHAIRQAADGSAESCDSSADGVLVHDPSHAEPSVAFALSRLTYETVGATPFGVFRDVERPAYDEGVAEQIRQAREQREGDLQTLLEAGDTWTIACAAGSGKRNDPAAEERRPPGRLCRFGPQDLGVRQHVDRDDRVGAEQAVAHDRPLALRLLDLGDERPREHERALTVRCGAELHDLASRQADDDAAELGRGPLLVVRKVGDGGVIDERHGGLHGCPGSGGPHRSGGSLGVSPGRCRASLPRVGYSAR